MSFAASVILLEHYHFSFFIPPQVFHLCWLWQISQFYQHWDSLSKGTYEYAFTDTTDMSLSYPAFEMAAYKPALVRKVTSCVSATCHLSWSNLLRSRYSVLGTVLPNAVVQLLDCSWLVPTKLMTVCLYITRINILYFKYCVLHLPIFKPLAHCLHSALDRGRYRKLSARHLLQLYICILKWYV